MANEKDITEKMLLDEEDVFADVVNGILFGGRQYVCPNQLESTGMRTQLKFGKEIHEQERDVAKLWTPQQTAFRFALFGFENQSGPDRDAPLRYIAYDGASYKEQVVARKLAAKEKRPIPPVYSVITVVLNFGRSRWTGPRSIHECLGADIPEEIKRLTPDYTIKVVDIAWMSDEELNRFQSDFKIVADLFVQRRLNCGYRPPEGKIRHTHGVTSFLSAALDDDTYNAAISNLDKNNRLEGGIGMCDIVKQFENRGFVRGLILPYKADGASLETAMEKIVKLSGLPKEDAETLVRELWNEN